MSNAALCLLQRPSLRRRAPLLPRLSLRTTAPRWSEVVPCFRGGNLSLLKQLPRTPLLPKGPSAPSLLAPKPLLLDLGAAVGPEASKLSPAQVKERITEEEVRPGSLPKLCRKPGRAVDGDQDEPRPDRGAH